MNRPRFFTGYVEYQYAVKNNISQAAVQNRAGKFVKATLPGMIAACQSAEAPGWKSFSASLINTQGADSFPITSFTNALDLLQRKCVSHRLEDLS
jgi:phosphate transport system substrate-binding protein